jgi:hypothetical protein
MITRIDNAQSRVLNSLLDDGRMNRMLEDEAVSSNKANSYTLLNMLDDLRHGLWSGLASSRVAIDPYRRALQNTFLKTVDGKVNAPPSSSTTTAGRGRRPPLSEDAKSQLRGELVSLKADIQRAISRSANPETRMHLDAASHRIDDILNPKK